MMTSIATSVGKRVFETLNKQINDEFQAALMFLAMSGVFSNMRLNGCAKWAKDQFSYRNASGLVIFDHVTARGMRVKILQAHPPRQDWSAPIHVFEEILRFEQKTTVTMVDIADICVADKDRVSAILMNSVIQDQIKKETTAAFLLDRLHKMQSTELGVIMFDSDLAKGILVETC